MAFCVYQETHGIWHKCSLQQLHVNQETHALLQMLLILTKLRILPMVLLHKLYLVVVRTRLAPFWMGLLSMAYLDLVRAVFVPIILAKERPLLLGYIEKAGTLDNGVFPCTHCIEWKPITPTQINGADTQTLMPKASNS